MYSVGKTNAIVKTIDGFLKVDGLKNTEEKVKSNEFSKKTRTAGIVVISAIIIVLFMSSSFSLEDLFNSQTADQSSINDDLEMKMEQKLSMIKGAGKVSVIISYEYSNELVPALVEDIQTGVEASADSLSTSSDLQGQIVSFDGSQNDSALIVKEKSAIVKGVVVIAEGADNVKVKLELLNAVKTLLGIDLEQIEVYEMNNQGE